MSSDIQIAVRLEPEIVSKLDALAEELTAQNPGIRVTRASALRMMALRGIAATSDERAARRRSR